jgi:hypothetical protein
VGQEGEFKIKKNYMYLKIPDGDKKRRTYQVVAMKPLNTGENATENTAYKSVDKPTQYRAREYPLDKAGGRAANPNNTPPPQ